MGRSGWTWSPGFVPAIGYSTPLVRYVPCPTARMGIPKASEQHTNALRAWSDKDITNNFLLYCPGGTVGFWTGTPVLANGISSSECSRLPAGSIMVGVTKIMRSPSTGTLSLSLVTFSAIKPPSTTVWPSQTTTEVVTWRTRKCGNGKEAVIGVATPPTPLEADWTCGTNWPGSSYWRNSV